MDIIFDDLEILHPSVMQMGLYKVNGDVILRLF